MSRFATLPSAPLARSPYGIGVNPTPTLTEEGGQGFIPSDPHVELFTAAVSGMLADQFYESADERISRLIGLVAQCDPAWLQQFIRWLRDEANLRSASVVLAAEYARASMPNARQVVSASLQRADEPAEMLGYWMSRYGRNVPSRVKRGVADAVRRLYNEHSLLRWDGQSKAWRFGDVIELVHPRPSSPWQSDLYRFALDRRKHDDPVPESLTSVAEALRLEALAPEERRANLTAAGSAFSWERLAGWLPEGMDKQAWEAVVPKMGYLALLRNLNNFDRNAVDPATVVRTLTDPDAVAKSRVMPFRFLTAYLNLEADTYKTALATAADVALANLPAFPGSTLIMVDCSGSMGQPVGAGKSRSPLRLSQAAAFMAEALARRCDQATIATYDTSPLKVFEPMRHQSVLRASSSDDYAPRGGTATWASTAAVYRGQNRIVIITDEQAADGDDNAIRVPVITWNLAGYQAHHAQHGRANRYLVAGYNDTALQVLPAVIATGSTGRWPWEKLSE